MGSLHRALGGEGIAAPRARGLKRGRPLLNVAKLHHTMHLTEATARVIVALRRHILRFRVHLVRHNPGAILTLEGLRATELGNKAVECIGHIIVIANGQESLLVSVAPSAPVRGGLVEAGPARRLAEGVKGLKG